MAVRCLAAICLPGASAACDHPGRFVMSAPLVPHPHERLQPRSRSLSIGSCGLGPRNAERARWAAGASQQSKPTPAKRQQSSATARLMMQTAPPRLLRSCIAPARTDSRRPQETSSFPYKEARLPGLRARQRRSSSKRVLVSPANHRRPYPHSAPQPVAPVPCKPGRQ